MAPYPSRVLRELKDHQGPVNDICFNKSGEYCLSGGKDKLLRLWNPTTCMLLHTFGRNTTHRHRQEVLGVAIAPNNGTVASCSADSSVALWDVNSGEEVRRTPGHRDRANAVAPSEKLRHYTGHYGGVNAIDFNDEGSVLVSGAFDGTLRLWDFMSVQVKGVEILAGCGDGKIRLYDLRMGQLYEDCIGAPVTSAQLSNDGHCILVGTADSTLRLMDKTNGRMLNEFKGHRHKESNVRTQSTLSNTDAYALSGSEDGRIYVWDVLDGQSVATLTPSESQASGKVIAVAYHPSDTVMLSAGESGVIHVWG